MKEFKIDRNLQFSDEKLSSLISKLVDCFDDSQLDFAHTCKTIHSICDYCQNNFFKAKDNEYYNSTRLLAKFGFDKSEVSRLKKCYVRFCLNTGILCVPYRDFSPSKLFELLPLSEDTTEQELKAKRITPDMTVKDIRQYVKKLTTGEKQTETVEEKVEIKEDEIPMAYDPTKEYEYSYFETKSKNQLLNMIWDLQKAYQNLIGERKNEKKK